ncbi:TMEM175 family protein [Lacticaseibacillus salsurivasis]|uniref:TMEM175 family protein n=1 Tax=Lacticaseibacillus salsurivasis TaxID=3081441 RepID=UPI0030C6976B
MEKLKSRLDAFSDGVMAVIITIMVLAIAPVLHDSWANYLAMGQHIGIYMITFVFVFNMWYQHSTAYAEIETMTYQILIWEVVFFAVLSLMPLFTDMMAENTTRVTVMLYGVTQAVISFLFRGLAKSIVHLQFTTKAEMQQVYQKIYGNANRWLDGLSLVAIIVGYFLPQVALFFYLAYPIMSFFLNADARQQMYDAEALPAEQQKDLAELPASAYVDWRKLADQLYDQRAAAAGQGSTPATSRTEQGSPRWSEWLNRSLDPRYQKAVKAKFQNATPEQRQQMAAWFAQQRRGRNNRRRDEQ